MIQRVDDGYRELSDALCKLGCAIENLFPGQGKNLVVLLPMDMHKELFGEVNQLHAVIVRGPFGEYRIEARYT